MTDLIPQHGSENRTSTATGVSKGGASGWSFEEAFGDAIEQLGSSSPGTADWLDTYTVTNIGARLGGIAGFNDLLVTVERGEGPGFGVRNDAGTDQHGSHMDNCREWCASHDHQPPGPKTLNVTGTCTFPRVGYTAELQPLEPQGINPRDLLLKLVIQEPGAGATVPTDVEVRLQVESDTEYESVTIVSVETVSPGGPSIPVEHVH